MLLYLLETASAAGFTAMVLCCVRRSGQNAKGTDDQAQEQFLAEWHENRKKE